MALVIGLAKVAVAALAAYPPGRRRDRLRGRLDRDHHGLGSEPRRDLQRGDPRSRASLAVVAALSIASCFAIPMMYPSGDGYWFGAGIGLLCTGVVFGWGLFVRARRELVRSLVAQADRAGEEARAAERRRIAREMHDVLAHRISLLSVHAGALEFNPDAPPAEVAEAAGVIRASARAALAELRDVIGVLREEDGADLTARPQPTLADLDTLVEESRAAGMRLTARIELGGEAPSDRRRPDRLPDRPGGADQRAQACARRGGDARREGARRSARDRGPQPGARGRRGGSVAAGRGDRPDRARGARVARGRRARARRRRGRRVRPAREAAAMIRVLLVDDDPLVRSGLRIMLAGAKQLEVVARGRRRPPRAGRGGPPPARRRAHGHPHAEARRHRRHAPARRAARPARDPRPDDLRRRRARHARAAGRRGGLPAQGHAARGDRAGDRARPRWRGDALAVGHPPAHRARGRRLRRGRSHRARPRPPRDAQPARARLELAVGRRPRRRGDRRELHSTPRSKATSRACARSSRPTSASRSPCSSRWPSAGSPTESDAAYSLRPG